MSIKRDFESGWSREGSARNRFVTPVVALVGAAIVVALFQFNRTAYSYNQYIVGNLIGLLFIPMLSILFVFREDPAAFGFGLGASRRVWFVVGVVMAGLLALLFVASRWQVFQDAYPWFRRYPEFAPAFHNYPRENPFTTTPFLMLYAEASYGLYLFCWEFFFRGYLLFGLSRSIGWSAVLAQAIAFGLLHFGKPTTEVVASFGAGIILGIIALNAKSFAPCFLLHWIASVAFDFMVVVGRSL